MNFETDFLERSDLSRFPIVKRDKHAIHFMRTQSQRVAVMQRQPIYYADGKILKPISTELKDSGYAYLISEGTPFRIYRDGLVTFSDRQFAFKSKYVIGFSPPDSFTILDTMPDYGFVYGNKLVREHYSSIYKYETIVTESGIKEQLIINEKPKIVIDDDYLAIATEIFNAPASIEQAGYGLSVEGVQSLDGTAWDSAGNKVNVLHALYRHTDDRLFLLTGIPSVLLENATYPITIDPSFDFYTTQSEAAVGDTYLNSATPTTNYGNAAVGRLEGVESLQSEGVALFRFDVTTIPLTAEPTEVEFYMYNIDSASCNLLIYESYRDWLEYEATWEQYASGLAWTWDGGLRGDYDRSSSYLFQAGVPQTAGDVIGTTTSATVMQLIKNWRDGVGTNKGFSINSDSGIADGNTDFAYSSYATAARRPRLTVTYDYYPARPRRMRKF